MIEKEGHGNKLEKFPRADKTARKLIVTIVENLGCTSAKVMRTELTASARSPFDFGTENFYHF